MNLSKLANASSVVTLPENKKKKSPEGNQQGQKSSKKPSGELLNKPNLSIPVNRTLHCKAESKNFYDVEDLMSAFTMGGSLLKYKNHVEGFETIESVSKEYSITFRANDEDEVPFMMSNFHQQFARGAPVVNSNGLRFTLRTKMPAPTTTLVTLYPVPIELSDEAVEGVIRANEWGACQKIERGIYRSHPEWKNGYVHAHISELNREVVPMYVVMGDVRVYVSVQDEATPNLVESISAVEVGKKEK